MSISFRVHSTFKARIPTMMNPRLNFRLTPFDYIRFFYEITRLGGPGLCALLTPHCTPQNHGACARLLPDAPFRGFLLHAGE